MATIKVSNLAPDVTKSDLKDLFSSYGFTEIIIEDIEDGNNERIAYVWVKDEISEGVVNKLNGQLWRDRFLRVGIDRGQNGDSDGDTEPDQPS
ncbi:MAG: RNA-binding protein [Rhizonema sp. PD37]|nr:RNA-binding protein [Rhizonema sp. PD37]